MTPDAPDVAEMVAFLEDEATLQLRMAQITPEHDKQRLHDKAAMLRAIAARLRRGGE